MLSLVLNTDTLISKSDGCMLIQLLTGIFQTHCCHGQKQVGTISWSSVRPRKLVKCWHRCFGLPKARDFSLSQLPVQILIQCTAHVCSHRHQRYVLCANTKNPKHRQPLHCSGTNKQTNKQKAKMQMLVGKGSYHLQGINEVSTRNGKSTLQYFDFSGCPCKHTGAPSWKTFWFQWVPIQAHSPKIMWFQWVFIQAHSQKILCSHWYYNSNLYCTELTCV